MTKSLSNTTFDIKKYDINVVLTSLQPMQYHAVRIGKCYLGLLFIEQSRQLGLNYIF